MALINEWWHELDPNNLREVDKQTFSRYLLKKKIIRKELEVDRLLKSMIGETIQDGTVKKTQFIKCFTKVILKAAILNIYYYACNNAKIGDEVMPATLKVLKFQRDLLIGGLRNEEEKLGVNCKQVVTGLKNALPSSSNILG